MDTNVTVGDAAVPAAVKSNSGEITDARGRKLVVKLLDPLETYRLARAMGPSADVDVARAYGSYAASVRVIDGVPQVFPNSDRDIQAMLQLLGSDGVEAVQKAIARMAEPDGTTDDTAAIKN
jgi:hypothetical protein